ncbi:uncharacterized protein DS421_13g401370 [Arachis hypogaea]|nr:uncharacterized protein DS421_13g401370 [Arachis hypogaea]
MDMEIITSRMFARRHAILILRMVFQVAVSVYVNSEGSWDLDAIAQMFPEEVMDHLRILKTPNPTIRKDTLGWYPTTSEKFSIKPAYDAYFRDNTRSNNFYKKLWKIKISQ